jgi:hypothetical protein
MYALVSGFCVAGNSIVGTRQAHTVYGTPATATAAKEAPKGNVKLRGAGAIRHWIDDSQPSRAPQGHAGLVG